MLFEGALHGLSMVFQVFVLDLILSGDNALVIALACRGLPAQQVRRAVMIGTSGAIILRVLLTTLAGWLLLVPWLKLVGALLLVVIAIRLMSEEDAAEEGQPPAASLMTLGGAVLTVLSADLIMSLDNVVGLAAVAQGSVFYLVLGLLLSVPLLMFGSVWVSGLLRRYRVLVQVGGALLGYVAGDIAVSDPVVVGWVNTQSPALNQVVPLLCAVFVLVQSRIIQRQRLHLPRPAPRLLTPVPVPVIERASAPRALPKPVAPEPVAINDGLRNYRGLFSVLVGLGVILLASGLLYSLIGGLSARLMPVPQKDNAYLCIGASTTLYFRPGGSSIRLVAGGGEAKGYVDYKKILWENPDGAAHDLHLSLPDEIEKTSATTVTLNGGSFAQIPCALIH
ncbi:TerC family protein [Pseudomonas costantinii]|uniref:TerC family protein n=1 Tax=Pseudomonas costantinii TaxID=168469 RepID=UPI0015A47CDF|nr:TerC family protein [Pseudomonas costantinii]NVZ67666.1 TerC family protein [Pseudomonas costantinii]